MNLLSKNTRALIRSSNGCMICPYTKLPYKTKAAKLSQQPYFDATPKEHPNDNKMIDKHTRGGNKSEGNKKHPR